MNSLFDVPPYVSTSKTSLESAIYVSGKTKAMRERVLEALKITPMSDEQICIKLQMSPNTARPRRVELVKSGQVVQVGVTRSTSGRRCAVWGA